MLFINGASFLGIPQGYSYIEYVLSNTDSSSINKTLFYYPNDHSEDIFQFIHAHRDISMIKGVFDLFGERIHHLGLDTQKNRYKFYITPDNISFKETLQIIQKIKYALGIHGKYFLEKDFIQFDSIGVDIGENGYDLKIYELVSLHDFEGLPLSIKKEHVGSIGYLKSFGGRKKKFFRFREYQDINKFSGEFDLSGLRGVPEETGCPHSLQKKVKYYCIERDHKELYFI